MKRSAPPQRLAVDARGRGPTDATLARRFGPLTGREWLEIDHWAFQEFPRRSYAAFRRLADFHAVPLDRWLEATPHRAARTRAKGAGALTESATTVDTRCRIARRIGRSPQH